MATLRGHTTFSSSLTGWPSKSQCYSNDVMMTSSVDPALLTVYTLKINDFEQILSASQQMFSQMCCSGVANLGVVTKESFNPQRSAAADC